MKKEQPLQTWNIALISTTQYLSETRKTIINNLEAKGIKCRAFEESLPEYPEYSDIDDCYARLERDHIDFAILIIDNHYGTIDDRYKTSVTRHEYDICLKKKIKVFKFLHKSVDYDFKTYSNNKDSDEINQTRYDDFEGVMNFVKAIKDGKKDNVLNPFDDYEELYSRIEKVLTDNTQIIIQDKLLNNKYINYVKKLQALNKSASLKEVITNLYSEPNMEVNGKFEEYKNSNVAKTLNKVALNESLLITGRGGYGKTTLLSKMFFAQFDDFKNHKSPYIPLLVFMGGLNIKDFTLSTIVEELLRNVLHKQMYPFFSPDGLTTIIYLDGFDEINGSLTGESVNKFLTSGIFANPVVLSCRDKFAFEYAVFEHFDNKIELLGYRTWGEIDAAIDKHTQYFDITDENKIKRIKGYASANIEVFKSPFMLYIYMSYCKEHDFLQTDTKIGRILRYCIEDIFVSNVKKKKITYLTNDEKDDILKVLGHLSWTVYCNRLKGGDFLNYEKLIKKYGLEKNKTYRKIIEMFLNLTFDGREVRAMSNENFMDFFCGQYLYYILIEAIRSEQNDSVSEEWLLYTNIKVEIIHICMDLMDEDEKIIAFENLKKRYESLRGTNAYKKIAWVLNLMLRTKVKPMGKFIIDEYSANKDRDKYYINRLTIEHCVIQLGQIEAFQSLYQEVEPRFVQNMYDDVKFDEFVRGCYLIYYNDTYANLSFPYYDDGKKNWERCFIAFESHINEPGEYRRSVRRLEFRLAEQFILNRDASELTDHMIDFYLNLPEEKYKGFEKEYQALCKAIEKKRTEKVTAAA